MTEPELDTAIDRAVRDLMNVDADSAFRTRVTARLERPARREGWLAIRSSLTIATSEGWTWVPRLLTVVVTAAAIIAAMLWLRPSPVDTPESTAALGTTRPAPVVSSPAPQSGLPQPPVRRVEQPPTRAIPTAALRPSSGQASSRAIPPGIIVATSVETGSDGLAPLRTLEAIQVAPIAQSYIAPADIVVAELSPIAELQVSPLEPPTPR